MKLKLLTPWFISTDKNDYAFWRQKAANAENEIFRNICHGLAMACIHNFLTEKQK